MIKTVKVGALEYLTAENITAPHCFTTRFGGVSSGYLASMNIGTHRGDLQEHVEENFRILARELGFDPARLVLTSQTHTDVVLQVGEMSHGAGLTKPALEDCDGLITATPGTALVVFTADCTPVLLHDPVTGAVGAVHAGWRGTAAGICGKAVGAMAAHFGSNPRDIRCAIGPNIAQCCFETDEDVPNAILEAYGKEAEQWIRTAGNKFYLDLKEINALSLRRAGVEHVEISTLCTACQPDRFWSHRRVGNRRGSQGAIIVCEEVRV